MRYPALIQTEDGLGIILPGHDLPNLRELATLEFGLDDQDGFHVQHWHSTYVPRVKHCSRYDGWGCDRDGEEFHSHWFACKPGHGTEFTVIHPDYARAARPADAQERGER